MYIFNNYSHEYKTRRNFLTLDKILLFSNQNSIRYTSAVRLPELALSPSVMNPTVSWTVLQTHVCWENMHTFSWTMGRQSTLSKLMDHLQEELPSQIKTRIQSELWLPKFMHTGTHGVKHTEWQRKVMHMRHCHSCSHKKGSQALW